MPKKKNKGKIESSLWLVTALLIALLPSATADLFDSASANWQENNTVGPGGIGTNQSSINWTDTFILYFGYNQTTTQANWTVQEGWIYTLPYQIDPWTPGADGAPPILVCNVTDRGVEWVQANCTATDSSAVTYSFKIFDNVTGEEYYVFDERTNSYRKFVGLKPNRRYRVEANATDTFDNTAIVNLTAFTKTGGEDMEIAIIIGVSIITVIFMGAAVAARVVWLKALFFYVGLGFTLIIANTAKAMAVNTAMNSNTLAMLDTIYIALLWVNYALWFIGFVGVITWSFNLLNNIIKKGKNREIDWDTE